MRPGQRRAASPGPASRATAGRQQVTYRPLYTGRASDRASSRNGGSTSHGPASQARSHPGRLAPAGGRAGAGGPAAAPGPAAAGASLAATPSTASRLSTLAATGPAPSVMTRSRASFQPGRGIQETCPRCSHTAAATGVTTAAAAATASSHPRAAAAAAPGRRLPRPAVGPATPG